MLFRVILGALVSAVVLFVWGFLFWVVLPFKDPMIRSLPNGAAVAGTLKESITETGTYFYPPMPPHDSSEGERKAAEDRYKAGPVFQLMYHKEGVNAADPVALGIGFVHYFITALLAGALLAMAAPSLPWYLVRVLFVCLAGLFAAVAVNGNDAIWFHYPVDYQLFTAGFHVSNWLLAGVVLGLFVRPPKR